MASVSIALSVSENLWYGVHLELGRLLVRDCQVSSTQQSCLTGQRERVVWTIAVAAGICLVGLLSAVLAGRLRRLGTVPVPAAALNHPQVVEPVIGQMNMRDTAVVWRPGRPVATARADGRGAGLVEVGPVFMASALLSPDRARAILAHELHHLRSRDVWPARLTLWLPVLLIPLILLDLVVSIARGGSTVAPVLVRSGVAAALVVGARTAVLRAREHDADLAAAALEPAALRSWLVPAPATSHPLTRIWASVARPHPSIDRRRDVVDQPNLALRLRTADALLVGAVAAIGAPVVTRLWRGWFGFGDPAFWSELAGWGIFGCLLGGWLVAQLFRSVAAARDDNRSVPWLRFGLVLGATLAVGALALSAPAALVFDLPHPVPLFWIAAVVVVAATVAVIGWVHWSVQWWWDRCPDSGPAGVVWVAASGVLGVGGTLAVVAVLANVAVGQASIGLVPTLVGTLNNSALSVWNVLEGMAGTWPARCVLLLAVVAPLPWLMGSIRRTCGLPAWASAAPQPVSESAIEPRTTPIPLAPSPSASARRRVLMTAGLGSLSAGVVAFGALEAALLAVPPADSWFTAELAALLPSLVAAGALTAVTGFAVVGSVAPPVLAGVIAAVGSGVLGGLMWVDTVLRGTHLPVSVLAQRTAGVAGLALVAVLMMSAVLPGAPLGRAQPRARRSALAGRIASIVVPAVFTVVIAVLISRPPPFAVDAQRQQDDISAVVGRAQAALGPCASGGADANAIAAIRAVEQEAGDPITQPYDPRLRQLSGEFTAILRSCREALERAVAAGSSAISTDDEVAIEAHVQRWQALDEALFPR